MGTDITEHVSNKGDEKSLCDAWFRCAPFSRGVVSRTNRKIWLCRSQGGWYS